MTSYAFSSDMPSRPAAIQHETTNARLWAGRIISGLAVLFMIFDGAMKIVKPAAVVEATAKLGYPESALTGIGITLLICTLLYVIPRTAILGAVLITGYLGGAVASMVRISTSLFETIFPILFAALVWLGLWLRDSRARNLIG
jgi:hypothetical protein